MMIVTTPFAHASAELIDRVLAVVNGSVVTHSDVEAAVRFGLVDAPPTAHRGTALERVIDRRLVFAEIERYAPPEPAPESVEASLDAVRSRFTSQEALQAALAETGFTLEALRRQKRDELRLDAYLQQRFEYALQPSEEDAIAYYRSHQQEFTRDGTLAPFDEVRAAARAAFVAQRRGELVREWIAGLRRRAEISIVPDP